MADAQRSTALGRWVRHDGLRHGCNGHDRFLRRGGEVLGHCQAFFQLLAAPVPFPGRHHDTNRNQGGPKVKK